MILRRITKHIRDQNWFAVGLDFVIVVAGILLAFQITHWSDVQREKASLARAQTALTDDLLDNYLGAKIQVAITECRMISLRKLGERLMGESDEWTVIPDEEMDRGWQSFDYVIALPKRAWAYRVWNSELARGNFDRMDPARRKHIDDIFADVQIMENFTTASVSNEGRLMILGQTTILTRPERNRLFEILGKFDAQASALALIGGNIVRDTDALELQLNDTQTKMMADEIERLHGVYLDNNLECFKPITTPYVDGVKAGEAP